MESLCKKYRPKNKYYHPTFKNCMTCCYEMFNARELKYYCALGADKNEGVKE